MVRNLSPCTAKFEPRRLEKFLEKSDTFTFLFLFDYNDIVKIPSNRVKIKSGRYEKMLRFESVFWASKNTSELTKRLESLGLNCTPSSREPNVKAVDFGSEAIEIFPENEKLATLEKHEGVGVIGAGLESDHISDDYKRLKSLNIALEKPRRAKDTDSDLPLWTGFSLPPSATPLTNAWIVMNSPTVLAVQSKSTLPLTHPNTCFGIEGLHLITSDPIAAATKWGSLMEKPVSGIQWNEISQTSGKRIQIGERFLDFLTETPALLDEASKHQGAFMLTLKVVDLELARALAQKAGANPKPCTSRDGFYIESNFTGSCALRFVRAYWKKYIPAINSNYPFGRRVDKFRPLGGADSSTLQDGFEDNWKY
jgi:hypothetical protein